MVELTTLILTFNERENIGRTIAALSWAKQIVIIDSFSTDEATEIAKTLHPNITVVQRRFDTHATQWNFGLAQIRTRWVLTLDADYELSRELTSEIAELKPSDEVSAYQARFQFRIFGCAANVFLSAFCTEAALRWLAGMVLCVPTHHRRIVIVDPATD